MLLRAYRISDRLGVVGLKLLEQVGTWLAGLVGLLGGAVVGILTLLLLIVTVIATLLGRVIKAFVRLVGGFLRLAGNFLRLLLNLSLRLVRGVGTVTATGVRGTVRSAGVGTSAAMARRAARTQIDVKLAEDPLRAQNRRLSAAVVLLGVVVIGILLWATDPSRNQTTTLAGLPVGGADALAGATQSATQEPSANVLGLPTPIAVATQVPLALRGGGTLAYTLRENGQTDLWLVGVANRRPVRITNDPSDERDPSWSADGTRLAYASHRDGNWEIYVFDLATQQTARITFDLSFQGNPKWSPDGLFLTYESYQGNNLDIYAVPIDGSVPAVRITDDPSPDYSPAWSYDGRKIAFVSLRDGNQDIYIFDLDTQETTNLTNTPLRDEDNPAWSRDDRQIAFSGWDNGSEKIFLMSSAGGSDQGLSFGRTPSWSPDGLSLTFAADSQDQQQTFLYALPLGEQGGIATDILSVPLGATDPTWSEQVIPPILANNSLPPATTDPLYVERSERSVVGAPFRLSPLTDVQAPSPVLNDTVNDSFNALRTRVLAEGNTDFLAVLDDAFWELERLPNPGEARRSWHMTGRAVAFQRTALLGFPPEIEVIREERGVNVYWRVMIRVSDASQSGLLGEPLRRTPWDFLSATGSDVEAYNQGGRYRTEVPGGYYVDLTEIAGDYGWLPLAAGPDWRANVAARNFWMLYKPEGLDWCGAMLEIYTAGEMVNFCGGT